MAEKKLTKGKDRVLWGVCSGIANYFGLDVTLVRIIWVVVTIGGVGSPILIYLICGLLMPNS
jgi:phage shock protein PspC (stress-responsive transcriptional regulator)